MNINSEGRLQIGGCDAVTLAHKFGTPLYVLDEERVRAVCRDFYAVLKDKYPDSLVCYASKALSCKAVYKIVASEGLGADVVSEGELLTALGAGFNADTIYFHGNNKSDSELKLAVGSGVHAVVVDSLYEAGRLDAVCAAAGKRMRVLVRVNPGIDAHTHRFIQTTRVDSKFGFAIADGSALAAIGAILKTDNLDFTGLHCHIGSQIFELKPFKLAVDKMTDFIKTVATELNAGVSELNLGGGYGITYTDEDKPLKPSEYVDAIVEKLIDCIAEKALTPPRLIFEPGRSVVGEAGTTLYTVGAVKDIKKVKKYISVDGGMFENPRYALYEAKYEAMLANRALEKPVETVTVAGKCCESGDMLVKDAFLPKAEPGDILAVFSTGAYNYSMAGNYNRNRIPPMVLVKDGKADYIIRPQTYDELLSRDVCPERLEGDTD
jgi:diaminopimelate decarboxylase